MRPRGLFLSIPVKFLVQPSFSFFFFFLQPSCFCFFFLSGVSLWRGGAGRRRQPTISDTTDRDAQMASLRRMGLVMALAWCLLTGLRLLWSVPPAMPPDDVRLREPAEPAWKPAPPPPPRMTFAEIPPAPPPGPPAHGFDALDAEPQIPVTAARPAATPPPPPPSTRRATTRPATTTSQRPITAALDLDRLNLASDDVTRKLQAYHHRRTYAHCPKEIIDMGN